MGRLLPIDSIGTPTRWLLVFNRKAETWWGHIAACGTYKHVRAFGYVAASDAYIFYDVQFDGTRLCIARGDHARRLMADWTQDADVLSVEARPGLNCQRWWQPLLCTTATAHLVGLPSGALRPDRLYAHCLRNGAISIGRTQGPPGPDRSDAGAAHEDCPAAAGAGASD